MAFKVLFKYIFTTSAPISLAKASSDGWFQVPPTEDTETETATMRWGNNVLIQIKSESLKQLETIL